jgi:hypothetical protein
VGNQVQRYADGQADPAEEQQPLGDLLAGLGPAAAEHHQSDEHEWDGQDQGRDGVLRHGHTGGALSVSIPPA